MRAHADSHADSDGNPSRARTQPDANSMRGVELNRSGEQERRSRVDRPRANRCDGVRNVVCSETRRTSPVLSSLSSKIPSICSAVRQVTRFDLSEGSGALWYEMVAVDERKEHDELIP